MKKFLSVVCFITLILSLAACGGEKKESFDPAGDAKVLLDAAGVFGEALTEIDRATACALYGIEESSVTGSAVYGSTSSAEELAIFTFSEEDAAQAAAEQLGLRVEDRQDELRDYLPNELPKLEKAVIEVRGASVLLVVAADYGPVETFLGD